MYWCMISPDPVGLKASTASPGSGSHLMRTLPYNEKSSSRLVASSMFTVVSPENINQKYFIVLYDFLGTAKVAPHECVIRTGQP